MSPVCAAGSPCILVAEDDFEMRSLLLLSLRRAGYAATGCRDGSDLLEHLTPFILHGDRLEFELIITDIRMPVVTGLEILEDLSPREGFPPIVLITAFGDPATHEQARALGAAALLDKPFEMDELLAVVRGLVPPRRPGAVREGRRSAGAERA